MKPAPIRKVRLRAVMVYEVLADDYHGLRSQGEAFKKAFSVKSLTVELAPWGSGKRGSLKGAKLNNTSNKSPINSTISLSTKNASNKLFRYIDLADYTGKKSTN